VDRWEDVVDGSFDRDGDIEFGLGVFEEGGGGIDGVFIDGFFDFGDFERRRRVFFVKFGDVRDVGFNSKGFGEFSGEILKVGKEGI